MQSRRQFLKRLLGAGAAVVAGPVVLELVKEASPVVQTQAITQGVLDRIYAGLQANALPHAEYDLYLGQEAIDNLMLRTVWYWNEKTLENLKSAIL